MNRRKKWEQTYQLGSGIPNADDKTGPAWKTAAYGDFRLITIRIERHKAKIQQFGLDEQIDPIVFVVNVHKDCMILLVFRLLFALFRLLYLQ